VKQTAVIAGVGMTPIGRHPDRTLSSLAREAVLLAITDAGISIDQLQAVWAGTAGAPIITGQTCIAGQLVVRGLGLGRVPVVNVENACATGSTAFQQACSMVSLGAYDIVLAFGVEKLYHPDKARTLAVFEGGVDVDSPQELAAFVGVDPKEPGPSERRSLFMDIYARWARDYMLQSGATLRDFAKVSAKNAQHGSLNPLAQFRNVVTEEEVLDSPLIAPPLTRLMCSPIADGAAAVVIVSKKAARELGVRKPIFVLGSLIASGFDCASGETTLAQTAARDMYAEAGMSPADLDCLELHDATAPAELTLYEDLGLCAAGEGPKLIRANATALGGRIPVNTSGGLIRKGHPIGATGLAQIHELTLQLRGDADTRQVLGARTAMAQNGGGFIKADVATMTLTVLARGGA